MKEQKRYHQRKLAIIEMIEECDDCIANAESFLQELNKSNAFLKGLQLKNSQNNIARYERIKTYLIKRYNN
jgi:hypothetical protein